MFPAIHQLNSISQMDMTRSYNKTYVFGFCVLSVLGPLTERVAVSRLLLYIQSPFY